MNGIETEVQEMTNEQFFTNRNDLIDLMIEKAKQTITDKKELDILIQEYAKLKR